MDTMNKERIRLLADIIEVLEDDRFNMGEWLVDQVPDHSGGDLSFIGEMDSNGVYASRIANCQTVGCAAGYAVLAFATPNQMAMTDVGWMSLPETEEDYAEDDEENEPLGPFDPRSGPQPEPVPEPTYMLDFPEPSDAEKEAFLADASPPDYPDPIVTVQAAAELLLGLTPQQADAAFVPDIGGIYLSNITAAETVAMLRHLATPATCSGTWSSQQ